MSDLLLFDAPLTLAVEGAAGADLLLFDVSPPAEVRVLEGPPDFILIDADRPLVVVDEHGADIVVITTGGPAGPPGPPGEGTGSWYTHIQSTPSPSWFVEHRLGRAPVVAVYVDGEFGLADIEIIDLDTCAIPFPEATTGIAAIR